jgi:hypothetical protein
VVLPQAHLDGSSDLLMTFKLERRKSREKIKGGLMAVSIGPSYVTFYYCS